MSSMKTNDEINVDGHVKFPRSEAALVFENAPEMPTLTRPEMDKKKLIMLSVIYNGSGATLLRRSPPNNRIIAGNESKFLEISFSNMYIHGDDDKEEYIQTIENILTNGIEVEGRRYLFCGFSNEQLQSQSCYMYAAEEMGTVTSLLAEFGDFSAINGQGHSVGEYAKATGLIFSTSKIDIELKQDDVAESAEVSKYGLNFADSCGTITNELANEIAAKLTPYAPDVRTPSALRVVYKGYSGILVTQESSWDIVDRFKKLSIDDADIDGHHKVTLVNSMRKFMESDKLSKDVCILDISNQPDCGKLNAELISMLSTLGIPDEVFIRKQTGYFNLIQGATENPKGASEFLKYKQKFGIAKILKDEVTLSSVQPWIKAKIHELVREETKIAFGGGDFERIQIHVPQSRNLIGIPDFTGKLGANQCLVRLTKFNKSEKIIGTVVVGKNPCLHPGDILRLNAVDSDHYPELAHLVDCIVFSTSTCVSGDEFDSGKFWVCWDKELTNFQTAQPRNYSKPVTITPANQVKITQIDLIRYFASYATNLGRIKKLYWAWIRENTDDRAFSSECQELSKIYARAMTGEKVTIPEGLKFPPEKSYGTPFIMDSLIKNIQKLRGQEYKKFLGQGPSGVRIKETNSRDVQQRNVAHSAPRPKSRFYRYQKSGLTSGVASPNNYFSAARIPRSGEKYTEEQPNNDSWNPRKYRYTHNTPKI